MPKQYSSVFLILSLLSGCSVNGSYIDPKGDNVAKIRFVAKNSSATLDWYNGSTCEGKTTGILNNKFLSDTKRRIHMKAPPNKDDNYLEIAVTPDEPVYLYLNTTGYTTVCSIPFSFVPQARTEYEAHFENKPGMCNLKVSKLVLKQGQVIKLPTRIWKTLPSCTNSKQ
ncbi:hypothetical protein HP532_16535 [Pseudomonas sp. CrR25]|nr:hypothetical protein [Pseudomonas sp. CrR25]